MEGCKDRLGIMSYVMKLAYEKNLINLLGGNASIRCGEGFFITPSQVPKNSLSIEDFVFIRLGDNQVISSSSRRPSIEWRMHKAVYVARPEAYAILHTHNPYTIALYDAGLRVDVTKFVEAYSIGECVETVPYKPAGSLELANSTAEALRRCRVAVLLNHGVISACKDLYSCLDALEALEDLSKITLVQHLLKLLSRAEPGSGRLPP
ncbi:MAG: class II aldolase/adducin family protein [Zestosphaera sp.]